jgi:hypothetical protein
MMAETNISAAKLAMMKASYRCLMFGVLALLPLIGAAFALAALWSFYVAKQHERQIWNPGRQHRIAGLICAVVGALTWGILDTILIYRGLHYLADMCGA